ncbi:MAG: hypothetical protein A2Z83_03020 [Omnitrophica bacterium GWA2_52_8]|nr:MAG: hypothetical protein A2Z83_03020 [Omnitrophica bacterium GWA2_52_8]
MKTKGRVFPAAVRMGITAVLILAAGRVLWGRFQPHGPAETAKDYPVYGTLPDVDLVERSGRAVNLSALRGKSIIAGFIFTRCAGVCPLMSGVMRGIQEKIQASPGIQLVSFSIDPENDTPEVLRAYAEKFQADPGKWFFFTGDKEVMFRLSVQHLHLGAEEIPEAEREALDQTIRHSSKFVLIDGAGRIRGYYESSSLAAVDEMIRAAGNLARLDGQTQ